MFALVTFDATTIAILLAISVAHVTFGLLAGNILWGGRVAAREAASSLQLQRAASSLSQIHHVASHVGEQTEAFAQELSAIGSGLSATRDDVDDEEFHRSLLDALQRMTTAKDQLQQQLLAAESKLQTQATQIETHMAEARTDALTGLANRRAFDDEMRRRMQEFQRKNSTTSVMLVDVDHFKKFNDTHGHQAGDEVLRGVAKVLYSSMREMDVVCRYGGEEFAVIMPQTDLKEAQRAAERARSAIAGASFEFEGKELNVTISGGLAQVAVGDSIEKIVQRADEALYSSKAAGRNCLFTHNGRKSESVALPPRPAAPDTNVAPAPSTPQLEYRDKQEEVAPQSGDPRTDSLTGLPNRKSFSEDLRRRMAQWRRFNTPLSLVLVDVDDLYGMNQIYGRDVGDVVLRAVTQFLTTAVREMDIVARYHGDEFVLMLPGTALDNAIRAAERIRNAVGLCKLQLDGKAITFTVSMGVAEATHEDDAISILSRAGTALDASKAAGLNCTHLHNGHTVCGVDTSTGVALAGPSIEQEPMLALVM